MCIHLQLFQVQNFSYCIYIENATIFELLDYSWKNHLYFIACRHMNINRK